MEISKHRWSGWPGAWCLDCGIADPIEECVATHDIEFGLCEDHKQIPCPEPHSHRFDPYYREPIEVYGTPEHEMWLIEMEQREG
jgi:hypothetical protein